jgi:adenosylmethionine-8-amino-7-oxononanoate aminotransferase
MTELNFKNKLPQSLKYDQKHVWHPYSKISSLLDENMDEINVWPVSEAKGVRLTLATGEELIDGMSSWWSAIHGYQNPYLDSALIKQTKKMSHVMFGGLTHEPAIQLVQALVNITPQGLDKVFLADSGSVAVEVAIKMAIQYQQARGKKEKVKMVSLKNGYHGDTLAAMSVCDPETGMHHLFSELLPKQIFVQSPQITFNEHWNNDDIKPLKECLDKNHLSIAALILEPIVQGAGGMKFYHPEYLVQARLLCDQYDVLLIADEIATGFGRTGEMFACNHAGITPDIMCLGKALTGGYMTLSATLTNEHIATTISQSEVGCFMHGPTFMGNPLACSVALASIKLLMNHPWQRNVKRIETLLLSELKELIHLKSVTDVRVLGAIGVIEMTSPVNMYRIQNECVTRGIWIRPFGKLVYVMPPYIISDEDLITLTTELTKILTLGYH